MKVASSVADDESFRTMRVGLVLGVGGLLLLYFNYLMVGPYLSPLFWSAILALLLRSPRDWLIHWGILEKLKAAEQSPSPAHRVVDSVLLASPGLISSTSSSSPSFSSDLLNRSLVVVSSPLRTPLKKTSLLTSTFVLPCFVTRRRKTLVFGLLAFWILCMAQTLFSGHLWIFLGLLSPVVLFSVAAACLIFVPVNTLVSLVLVSNLMLCAVAVGGVFAAQVVQESADFAYGLAETVRSVLGEQQGGNVLMVQMMKWANRGTGGMLDSSGNSVERTLLMLSSLYAENHVNGTQGGLRQAIKSLQGIFKFEDELLESLVQLNYRNAFLHPIDTFRSLLLNSSVVLHAFWKALGTFGSQLAMMLLSLSLAFFSYTFSWLIFLASLFYLVQSDSHFLDRLLEMLPVSGKAVYKRIILSYIRGIFLASFWSFLLNAVCTGLVFWLFNIQQFLYTSMLLAGMCAMFPVVPVWLVFLFPAGHLAFSGLILRPAVLMGAGFAMSWFVAPLVYLLVPYSHPYVTGLSLVLGIYTFGLEGVLLGPLIVCFTLVVYSILMGHDEDAKHE